MFVAFLESIKFIAHLLPVSFLRIFMGYLYLEQARQHILLGWLDKPILSTKLSTLLTTTDFSPVARNFTEIWLIPYWLEVSFIIIAIEIAIGVSYLVGYLVRPLALLGVVLVLGQMTIVAMPELLHLKVLLVIHFFLAWIGAGRVLGFDYYFYKRDRGIWW